MQLPLLSLMLLIPLMGVLFLLLVKSNSPRNAKAVAFWIACVNLFLALVMLWQYNPLNAEFQFVEKHLWIESLKCFYFVGVDGLSIYFVALSALLTPICILVSFTSITKRVREYMMAFLLLETFMIGVFVSLDLILFYMFFEGVLIPMFLIIGIWGGQNRIYACFKFFLYTFFASVFMLIAFMKLYSEAGTTNLLDVQLLALPLDTQQWIFWAFAAAFAVKIPMFPVHTWLPDAHTEAPTAGSVILAGVLLKLGGYGFLRIALPIVPDASLQFAGIINTLSVIGIVYASLVAMSQTDIKKLIAYSSIAHMGFVTLGIFSFQPQGYSGAVMQMLSHGVISGALFLCVGVVYERFHTREISFYSGLTKLMPKFSVLFFLIMLGAIGVPGTSGFVGEFLVLIAAFKVHGIYCFVAALGMILGAVYMLWLYRRVFMGKLSSDLISQSTGAHKVRDVTTTEMGILSLLIVLLIGMGIYPKVVLTGINNTYAKVYPAVTK